MMNIFSLFQPFPYFVNCCQNVVSFLDSVGHLRLGGRRKDGDNISFYKLLKPENFADKYIFKFLVIRKLGKTFWNEVNMAFNWLNKII